MDQSVDYSVVAFGETASHHFPLVLVFGRESNGNNKVVPGIAIYDETVSSGSSFWNRSLMFVQRCADSNLHLRNQSISRNAGPVIFTNAFPRPILNAVKNKDDIRASLSDHDIDTHISSIFNLDIIKRVKVVVFSTGPGIRFNLARKKVKELCDQNEIMFVEVPYFANPSATNDQIDMSIKDKEKLQIKSVVSEYYDCTDKRL